MKPDVLVPVQLGCCPEPSRCLLCNPPPTMPADKVEGLVARYRAQAAPGAHVVAHFFGGPPPTDAQVAALGGLPFRCRVRPDLLSRADADRLIAAGCTGIELDVLTFDDFALKAIQRRHRRAFVIDQARGLRAKGLAVGMVLAPGLPGTNLATCVEDAHRAAELADTVRLHPVLVLDRAGLREAHMDGRYLPLAWAMP